MTIELKQKQKRLTSGKKGCYDKIGNREQVTENAITTTYKPNLLNQYETINGTWLKYDNNGNLTKYQGIEYTYDAQNRLLSVNSNNNPIITFTYDGRNRCIKRVINGTTNYLYYDNWDLIEEYDASNNLLASYIHGNRMDEILTRMTPTTQIYYHHDALGSVTHFSDLNGHIIEKYVYDPFGKLIILNATNGILLTSAYDNRFLFAGREYLKEIGLYDFRNRIFSLELGRFLQSDPIGFKAQDINLYRYVFNNPTRWRDPLGLAAGDWWDLPANCERANELAKEELKKNRGHNDSSDAERHAEWNRRMSEELGEGYANLFGTAHELEGLANGQPWDEAMMDLHNNAEGREAFEDGRGIDPSNLQTSPGGGSGSPSWYPY